ncbi:MAG TPA: type I methionyl aminopeptidase [Paludibacteraceae bacterium]|jgi:methionyl aminopeptidase|nr:type I methionyl aminopeptidase [Paludibacteraceae bacterium]
MIFLKTDEEIELMRISNDIVAHALAEVGKNVKPGITTLQLDKIAETFIRDNGANPSFLGYEGYTNSICTSVNDQVVHAIPSKYVLKEGDIISVDCGAEKSGFHGDSCYTFCVGEVSEEARQLLKTTRESLYEGIKFAVEGKRIGDVGHAIQTYCENRGYSVVHGMNGHGIGRSLHEEPRVPNYGKSGFGTKLKTGMVIAIEPMINLGNENIYFADDGWTAKTSDGKISAHFEHTVAIAKGQADILSSFKYIDEILENNVK